MVSKLLSVVCVVMLVVSCQGCRNSCDCPLQHCCRKDNGMLVTTLNYFFLGDGTCQFNSNGIPLGGMCDPACITCTCGETDGYVCSQYGRCISGYPWL